MEKQCIDCLQFKKLSQFTRHASHKDGYCVYCKICSRKRNNESYQRKKKSIKNKLSEKDVDELFQQGLRYCAKCNQKKQLDMFCDCSTIRLGKSRYCRECMREYHHSLKGRYSAYKSSAKTFKRKFSLTIEEFKKIIDQPCFYCGDTSKNRGIDRVDNWEDYEINNCVSCCKICNFMKENKTKENFIFNISKIETNIDIIKSRIDNFTNFIKNQNIPHIEDLSKFSEKLKQQYWNYVIQSKKKDREFQLSRNFFQLFEKKECIYCTQKLDTSRIDRINNTIGYIVDNIVPCCKDCNYLKKDLSLEEFLLHVEKIKTKFNL